MSPSLLLDNPLSTADLGVQNISQILVWPEQGRGYTTTSCQVMALCLSWARFHWTKSSNTTRIPLQQGSSGDVLITC